MKRGIGWLVQLGVHRMRLARPPLSLRRGIKRASVDSRIDALVVPSRARAPHHDGSVEVVTWSEVDSALGPQFGRFSSLWIDEPMIDGPAIVSEARAFALYSAGQLPDARWEALWNVLAFLRDQTEGFGKCSTIKGCGPWKGRWHYGFHLKVTARRAQKTEPWVWIGWVLRPARRSANVRLVAEDSRWCIGRYDECSAGGLDAARCAGNSPVEL